MRAVSVAVAAACVVSSLAPAARAADAWPSKPIRVIVTQASGSGPDLVCRYIMDRLGRALGVSIVVDDRPGGVNVIGTQAAARAAPDGYTMLFATAAGLVTNPHTFKSLPYDPNRDFVPVGLIGKGPFVVLANPKIPARSMAELIAAEKANPGGLSAAVDGPRFFTGMLTAYINRQTGMQLRPIAYNNVAQGLQDAVAGRTEVTIQPVAVVMPFLRRGDLRALAVSGASRYPTLPDVPTLSETVPGMNFIGWFALMAPTGTPAEAIQRTHAELDRILKDQEVQKRLLEFGFTTDGAETPEALAAFIRAEYALWGKVVREIGVEPE